MVDVIKGEKIAISEKFVIALSIISILSFIDIISATIFATNIHPYIESLWLLIIGVGFVIEGQVKRLKTLGHGVSAKNFANLTTIVIGLIAIFGGILSVPFFGITNPAFLATKGIVSIIAILVIVIHTWVAHH